MKHYLRRFLFLILAVVPLTCMAGDLLGSYTMNINETKTLYLSSSMQSILKHTTTHWGYTTWTSSNSSVVKVYGQGKTSCSIQVVGYVSGQIKIEYDVYWADAYYNYVHSKDYYYITVRGGSSPNTQITISASPSGGEVTSGSKVTLSTNPTGANIYYTLDGTTPTSSSTIYTSSGITINNNCTLKAIAKKSGYTDSNVLTAYYTVASTYKVGDTFTAKTTEGIDMTFKVTNTSPKTCEVYKNAISQSTTGKVTIPSEVNGFKVTSIGDYAFDMCSKLTNVSIPNSITSIGYEAFWHCGLEEISIPNSVTSLGEYTFQGCTNLRSVTLSTSLKRLERYTFSFCTKLETIKGNDNIEYLGTMVLPDSSNSSPCIWEDNLPEGINYFGKVLYKYVGQMPDNTTINIPDGCTQIYGSFDGNEGLVGVTIPASVKEISSYAFTNCPNLRTISVYAANPVYDSRNNCNAVIKTATNTLIQGCSSTTIPTSVTSIGYSAFYGNWTKDEILIPNNIDSIANYAFEGCNNVKSILIGKGLRKIGLHAFAQLPQLKEVTVAIGNPYFDSRNNCNAIIEKSTDKLVVGCAGTIIPNTVKTIDYYAYYGNSNDEKFTTLVIPNSVEEIKSCAFKYIPYLKYVSIGENVKSFGNELFEGCKKLTAIEALNGFPDDINERVFSLGVGQENFIYDNVTLYVPISCRNNYRLASGWNNFKNIVEGSLADGIDNPITNGAKSIIIYSPNGVRHEVPQKGINIINGKKLLKK